MSYQRLEELPQIRLGERRYQGQPLRLNLSESIIPWPEDLIERCRSALSADDFIYYPADLEPQLIEQLSTRIAPPSNARIILGNGSFELLNTLFQVFCLPKARVLSSFPDFFMYPRLSHIYGSQFEHVRREADLSLELTQFLTAIEKQAPDIIFLSNPNNPTTQRLSLEAIGQIASASDGIVVIDEAYIQYTQGSAVELIEHRPNIIVVQTLSKVGFAGLRLGYLLCDESLETVIKKCILPFSVNTLSLKMAQVLLSAKDVLEERIATTIQARDKLINEFKQRPDYTVYSSHANFINLKHNRLSTKALYQHLFEHNIIVTPSHIPGYLDNCVRIGIGLDWHHQQLLSALDALNFLSP